jgi:hypothetical protein
MHTMSIVQAPSLSLASGITIPDSKMAREITELIRDTRELVAVQPFKPRLLLFLCNRQTEKVSPSLTKQLISR